INAIQSTDDVVKAFGSRTGGGGRGGGGGGAPFSLNPSTDAKNSAMVILTANQGGLSLNREDYLGTRGRAPTTRANFTQHVIRSLQLIGESVEQASADANTIMTLETSL